jgi:hypothetical protein
VDVNQRGVVIAARRERWARSLSSSHEGDGVDDKPRVILLRVQPLYRGVHVLSLFLKRNVPWTSSRVVEALSPSRVRCPLSSVSLLLRQQG